MTNISPAQLNREAREVALWQTPYPKPDAATLASLTQLTGESDDQGAGNKAGGDQSILPGLGPLASFGTWESVGSTIVHQAELLSDFNPGSVKFDPVAWENFLKKFSTIPFFLTYVYDYRTASISKVSLEKAVDAVSDLIQSFMTPENFAGVVTSIQKIGQLAMESEGKKEKNSNQQVGVLSRHESKLYLGAVRTSVEMEYKTGKGFEQLHQDISVYRGYGVLDFDKCIRHAETLLRWDRQDVGEWEAQTASEPYKPNDSPAWNH